MGQAKRTLLFVRPLTWLFGSLMELVGGWRLIGGRMRINTVLLTFLEQGKRDKDDAAY